MNSEQDQEEKEESVDQHENPRNQNLTLALNEAMKKNREDLHQRFPCFRYRARRCCINIKLDDGLLGIVVWDSLYALFVVTTTLSILVKQAEMGKLNNSLTDLITSAFLGLRAIVGMRTCCSNFDVPKVRVYLIVRLCWNLLLIIFNITMAGLRSMQITSFLTKLVVMILIDGYFNFIIYSYLSPDSSFMIKEAEDNMLSELDEEVRDDD